MYWAFSTYTFYILVFYGYSVQCVAISLNWRVLRQKRSVRREREGIRYKGRWLDWEILSTVKPLRIFFNILLLWLDTWLVFNFSKKEEKFNNKLICDKLCNNHFKKIFKIISLYFFTIYDMYFFIIYEI